MDTTYHERQTIRFVRADSKPDQRTYAGRTAASRACNDYGSLDFNAAKQDYDETYDLMELFASDATEAEMPAEPEDKLPTERSSCRPVQSPPSGRTLLQPDTTFHWSPNTGDFLLWIRCANPLCNPPEFAIADFWEFREGDHLLITNREEDYPAPVEQMEEGGPALWKVRPGDRLTWVGWRWSIDCSHEGYVYGEPAHPTLESVMSFGTPTTEATPDARSLWMVGYNAVMALGVPRTWCPLEYERTSMQQNQDSISTNPSENHAANGRVGSFEELLKLDPKKIRAIEVLPRQKK